MDEQQFLTETVYDDALNTKRTLRYATPVTVSSSDTLASLKSRAGAFSQTSLIQYDDFGRVLLNTTFGLGGIFDLASMMGIEKHNQDFGITFGKWGIDQGPYLFVPLFGPTTVRDGTGTVVRAFLGPITYIVTDVPVRNVIYGIGYLNQRAQALDTEGVVDTAAIDKYRFIRNAYLRARRFQVYDGKPPPEQDDEGQ